MHAVQSLTVHPVPAASPCCSVPEPRPLFRAVSRKSTKCVISRDMLQGTLRDPHISARAEQVAPGTARAAARASGSLEPGHGTNRQLMQRSSRKLVKAAQAMKSQAVYTGRWRHLSIVPATLHASLCLIPTWLSASAYVCLDILHIRRCQLQFTKHQCLMKQCGVTHSLACISGMCSRNCLAAGTQLCSSSFSRPYTAQHRDPFPLLLGRPAASRGARLGKGIGMPCHASPSAAATGRSCCSSPP